MSIVKFKGKVEFQCKCSCKEKISSDEFDFDIVEAQERKMGVENHYSAKVEKKCNRCKELYSVEVELWEYPIGMVNNSDASSVGGEILNKGKLTNFFELVED